MSLPLRVVLSLLAATAVVVGLVVVFGGDEPEPEPTPEAAPEPEPEPEPEAEPEPVAFAPLTGTPIFDQDEADELAARPLLIVKVENSAQARPQTGLDGADVVIEELVEGGITRFITLFHSQLPEMAGPVRSARPIDVQVASGFTRPVFAHSGARAEVQRLLAAAPIVSLEEGAQGFVRSSERPRPHNLYVRPADLLVAGLGRDAEPLADVAFTFSEEPPEGELTCPADATDCDDPGRDITISMSGTSRSGFNFDDAEGVYRRTQNASPFTVTGDGTIGAANVVVLATRHYSGGCCDTAGNSYPETDVVGGDRALVLRDGKRYEARWEKASASEPLRLLTVDGDPFPLRPGPTWMLLPDAGRVPA